MKRFLLIFSLLLLFSSVYSQPVPANNSIVIQEPLIDSFFKALEPVQGSKVYPIMGTPLVLSWRLEKIDATINNGTIAIATDLFLTVDRKETKQRAKGTAHIEVDQTTKKVFLVIDALLFDAKIEIFGATATITDIDLAQLMHSKFELFALNQLQTMRFSFAEGQTTEIKPVIDRLDVLLQDRQIIINSFVHFE